MVQEIEIVWRKSKGGRLTAIARCYSRWKENLSFLSDYNNANYDLNRKIVNDNMWLVYH